MSRGYFDAVGRFVARENIRHFADRLAAETDPPAGARLKRLLVPETDKIGGQDTRALHEPDDHIARAQEHVHRQQTLLFQWRQADRWCYLGKAKNICSDGKRRRTTAHSSLRDGHKFEDVAVEVLEIEAAAAIPIVELSVIESPGAAAEGESGGFDPLQDGIELGVTHVKGINARLQSPPSRRQSRASVCRSRAPGRNDRLSP